MCTSLDRSVYMCEYVCPICVFRFGSRRRKIICDKQGMPRQGNGWGGRKLSLHVSRSAQTEHGTKLLQLLEATRTNHYTLL